MSCSAPPRFHGWNCIAGHCLCVTSPRWPGLLSQRPGRMFQPLWRELGAVPFSLWEESEPAFAACLLERLCFVLAPKRDPAVLAPRSLDQAVKAGPPRLKSGSLCGSTVAPPGVSVVSPAGAGERPREHVGSLARWWRRGP